VADFGISSVEFLDSCQRVGSFYECIVINLFTISLNFMTIALLQ